MKRIMLLFIVLTALISGGCNSSVNVKDAKNMTTAEIIEVLENADIEWIVTSHSQHIEIRLKDGTELSGRYNPDEAPPKYQETYCRDILNLSLRIKESRIKKWQTIAE